VDETDQPYVYTGGDPVVGTDPTGLNDGGGGLARIRAVSEQDQCKLGSCASGDSLGFGFNPFAGLEGFANFGRGLLGLSPLSGTGNPLLQCSYDIGEGEFFGLGVLRGVDPGGGGDVTTIDADSVADQISAQAQDRHILGTLSYNGGGYFTSVTDAQQVLDDFHNGDTTILGRNAAGQILVRDNNVVGYNNNPGANYFNQPTNVFVIKGTVKVSVYPTSPGATP
jgi:hypothetical protein